VSDPEPTITDRIGAGPAFEVGRVREVRPRDLGVRFISGALTSVVAGVVTLVFGARPGGILLAFPAILAASLTLIEEEEDAEDAREDSRGAVVGGAALIVFALVAALTLTRLGAVADLALAAGAWLLVALGVYAVIWYRRPSG
jgi:uncharacterized protein DUF3147